MSSTMPAQNMADDLIVPLDDGGGTTTATCYMADAPAAPAPTLILAHGAGAGHRHPFMTAVARGLTAKGVHVVTFNFPYMERQRRAPTVLRSSRHAFDR